MFPVVPQFIFDNPGNFYSRNSSESETNFKRTQFDIGNLLKLSGSVKTQSGAFLVENVVKQTNSKSFAFNEILLDDFSLCEFGVKLGNNNRLCPVDSTIESKFWIKNIKIAKDVPSANCLLNLVDDKLEVTVIKDLIVNEELVMWFSDELISIMAIPFLTPANIQDQKRYICQQCLKVFEYPNPLKIHLARNCDRFGENILWQRVHSELLCRYQRKFSAKSNGVSTLEVINQSSNSGDSQSLPVAFKRFSAFQPVPSTKNLNGEIARSIASASPPSTPPSPASISLSLNESALSAAAHLETIVSNMGTSKQGHLCIYCGKLYSRKYGLKIHIRTHTGFKPLKCKYCLRPFGDPSNLNKHVRLHTQSNSVNKCTICNKVLVRRRDLQRHLQLKHGKPHLLESNQNLNNNQTENFKSSKNKPRISPELFQKISSESE